MRLGFGYEKRSSFFTYIVIVLAIFAGVFIWINIKVVPFIISVAQGYAENAVSNTLNDIVNKEMSEEEYEFVNLLKDGEGKICAVTMNSGDTNLLMTEIAIGLREKISDMDEIEADIPLGNFTPYPFFAGLGPKIPVKFIILATTGVEAEENFQAQGINQTLYTLNLNVGTKVEIYIPAMHSSVRVESKVPIAQTLIVGNVPDTYTNIEGMEGTVQDTVLDVE